MKAGEGRRTNEEERDVNEERKDIARTRSPAPKELFPFASREGAKHMLATTIDSSDFAEIAVVDRLCVFTVRE